MKKKLIVLIVSSMFFLSVPVYANTICNSAAKVYIDDSLSSIQLKNVNGYTYIGLRDLSDLLGYSTNWYDPAKMVIVSNQADILTFTVGKNGYIDGNLSLFSANTPIILNDKVYVALRDVLTGMGVQFSYSSNSNSISIYTVSKIDPSTGKTIVSSEEYFNTVTSNINNGYNTYSTTYDYVKQLQEQQAKTAKELQNALEQMQETTEEAYSSLQTNYNGTSSYTSAPNYAAYEEACREAYIEYQIALKNLSKQLAANGQSGELTESTKAELYNKYISKMAKYKKLYNIPD